MIYRILASALFVFTLAHSADASAQEVTALEHKTVSVSTTEGLTLSGYISRPTGSQAPLPALFLTQWVSCGSVAPRENRVSLEERLALAAGYALIRVDRAGEASSEGPGCNALDYNTEVRHYREALAQISKDHWVDSDRIVIYGSSLGSTTAPLVADGNDVAGVIVQGGGALTYLERMLHFDRQQLERQADFAPDKIHAEMLRRMEFQRYYLLDKMTPEAIEEAHPHLAGVWNSLLGTDTKPHYGRPHAWHWQAAEKDWLSAWARIKKPVMVIYAEYDQFEPRQSHRVIVDTINRLRPGTATWLEIPHAGHGLRIYPDPVSAYAWSDGESRPELFVEPVSKWLRSVAGGE